MFLKLWWQSYILVQKGVLEKNMNFTESTAFFQKSIFFLFQIQSEDLQKKKLDCKKKVLQLKILIC